MNTAPIALFVYNRPEHTRLAVEALARNTLAAQSDLLVFSDGPRNPGQAPAVEKVRSCLRGIKGFRSVKIAFREINYGLSGSIIEGVTQVCAEHGRVIVVEDDLVTSPHFLAYMNDALAVYEAEETVASVHGYVYPVDRPLPETFFIRGADCWGWSTWQRAWKGFNPNGAAMLDEIGRRGLTRQFDYNGAGTYTKMLRRQVQGRNDSWAIRWHASAFLADRLTLYPGTSLVSNIGFADGTHYRDVDFPDVALAGRPIRVERLPCRENAECRDAFERFFRQRRRITLKKVFAKIVSLTRAQGKADPAPSGSKGP